MMTDYMTEGRFLDLIEAYGADPARWPEAERKAATAFVEAHADFAEPLLAEAQALDDRLGPAEIEPSDLLQARLLAALPAESGAGAGVGVKREEKGPLVRGVFSGWRAPVAAAAALVIGVAIGFGSGMVTPVETLDDYDAFAFSSLEDDWIDWLEAEA